MSRQYEAIDLMALYSKCNSTRWNEFLSRCLLSHDIQTLVSTRYSLQAGMADLAKKKLNSEKMIEFFLRLERSIEKTLQKIQRSRNPNPCDQPLLAIDYIDHKDKKNKRDLELELFLRKTGY